MRATMGVSGRRLGPDAGDRHAFWLMLHQGVRLALEAEVRGVGRAQRDDVSVSFAQDVASRDSDDEREFARL